MPMAMPTYAPVVRLLLGGELDAAGVGDGLPTGDDVLFGVVVVAVVLELEGRILVRVAAPSSMRVKGVASPFSRKIEFSIVQLVQQSSCCVSFPASMSRQQTPGSPSQRSQFTRNNPPPGLKFRQNCGHSGESQVSSVQLPRLYRC